MRVQLTSPVQSLRGVGHQSWTNWVIWHTLVGPISSLLKLFHIFFELLYFLLYGGNVRYPTWLQIWVVLGLRKITVRNWPGSNLFAIATNNCAILVLITATFNSIIVVRCSSVLARPEVVGEHTL